MSGASAVASRPLFRPGGDPTGPVPLQWHPLDTQLGLMVALTSTSGLVALIFAASIDKGLSDLNQRAARRFRHFQLVEAPGTQRLNAISIEDLTNMRSSECLLPLDPGGTPFQQSVWNILRDIPSGEVRNYSDIALAVGRPAAVRAVATACAANPLAVVIPCHRVIGSDGSLRGYRWGLERKRQLLQLESERRSNLLSSPKDASSRT